MDNKSSLSNKRVASFILGSGVLFFLAGISPTIYGVVLMADVAMISLVLAFLLAPKRKVVFVIGDNAEWLSEIRARTGGEENNVFVVWDDGERQNTFPLYPNTVYLVYLVYNSQKRTQEELTRWYRTNGNISISVISGKESVNRIARDICRR